MRWRWIPLLLAAGLVVAAFLSPVYHYFEWLPVIVIGIIFLLVLAEGDSL